MAMKKERCVRCNGLRLRIILSIYLTLATSADGKQTISSLQSSTLLFGTNESQDLRNGAIRRVFPPRGGRLIAQNTLKSGRNGCEKTKKNIPIVLSILHFLNASSKWILAAANLFGVWAKREDGAFIVIGCIIASFVTEKILKPIINQGRPQDSPLSDPGMPSSHSLASFFVAIGWMEVLGHGILVFSIATIVSLLRIVCGYHTMAQISVGAMLGLLFGNGWVKLGTMLKTVTDNTDVFNQCLWTTYTVGSILFIVKIMPNWIMTKKQKM